ncbi:UDP-N-acetylglucosamine--N-acetylmuramyl-(pentapeptide) pyrophosphoryl-undecaprenol N-acetylglucosamine transferase [Candidatus Uhrbacteria bacterium]|nr:UDP-N-acetylglucosamine--N-acetylmuramyl-(pentapeptide) pyrophosphoryl-undecaprenol N-acetylglucosamine transferase [Candidatus Uhrbacteria bacterium]
MMKIVFVGGGTLGPVMPLIAVWQVLKTKQSEAEYAWIGTPNGPEKKLIEERGISFYALPVLKFPRYPSILWITFPFQWWRVHRKAKRLIEQLRPDIVVTAGGFTAVPIVAAARQSKIPCVTHQLDLEPGLANQKIARACTRITTSFDYARNPFGNQVKTERIATPVHLAIDQTPSKQEASKHFHLQADKPITLIFGGGTGAQSLNEMLEHSLPQWLTFTQIIHGTGQGKGFGQHMNHLKGFFQTELFDKRMLDAYAAADLIICRGGMGSLSEISALKKAMIIVPIPNSQQEANAHAFEKAGAAIVVHQKTKTFQQDLISTAQKLLQDEYERYAMGERAYKFFPTDDGSALAEKILQVLKNEPIRGSK